MSRHFMCALLLALGSITSYGAELRVGAAQEVITPAAGTPMAGGYSPRTMEGVDNDLHAKAIVIEQDGMKVALVVCDLLGMPRAVSEEARALIAKLSGIPTEHVMISGTHTHTAPIVLNNSARDPQAGPALEAAKAYAARLPELIAKSVRDADSRLATARVRSATGNEPELSFNRRYVMSDGTVGWNPGKLNPKIVRPAGPIDPEVPLLLFESIDGAKPLAAYVNFAMHLDTTGGLRISADFPHTLSKILSNVMGAEMVTVFSTGACGDINHLDVSLPDPQNGPQEAARIGTILAGEVIKTTTKLREVTPGALRVKSELISLPVPEVTAEEFEKARDVVLKIGKSKTAFMDRVQAFKVLDVAARKGKPFEAEVQVIAMGDDVAWVGMPGEIFVELGLEVKRRSPFKQTILVELANGYLGYIPTKRAFAEGNYEPVSARCAPGSGELLVETAVKLLKELKPSQTPEVALPAKDKLHLYLLMGQSNMAGRGVIEDEDKTSHPRVVMLNLDGKWESAIEPVTRDRKSGLGVGPGLAFGKAMAEKHPNVTIGLVPCAVGGTPLGRWQKGGDLYERAMTRAKQAAEVGTLKGILWHQGESEAGDEKRATTYGERLAQMVRNVRAELGQPELPFVAGQLGEFLYTRTGNKSPFARQVNEGVAKLSDLVPNAGMVESKGLTHKGDELHFDAVSEREMGRRYASALDRIEREKIGKR